MTRVLCALLILLISGLSVDSQTPKPQSALINSVAVHKNAPGDDVLKYDVSLKIDNTLYVVMYTPPSGSKGVEYAVGQDVVALVGSDSITVTRLGTTSESPILSRETLPPQSALDWTRMPSEYFSMKLRNLSEKLSLSEEQQAKIKPVLEQEAAESGQITANPVLSLEDKLSRLEQIVRASDQKIKPVLLAGQWQTLQGLRSEQKQEIKQFLAARSQSD